MTENQYQSIVLDMRMMSKRIGAIEERCTCKVKWKAEIEKRINGIEALLKKAPPIFLDKPNQERIKYTEEDLVYILDPIFHLCNASGYYKSVEDIRTDIRTRIKTLKEAFEEMK